jgi:hypothetical protein
MQVPAQHRDESVVWIRLPEQVSSVRQITPPISGQVFAISISGVWTGAAVTTGETTGATVCPGTCWKTGVSGIACWITVEDGFTV